MGSTAVALWCKDTCILLYTGINYKTVQTGDHACTHTYTQFTYSWYSLQAVEVTTPDNDVVSPLTNNTTFVMVGLTNQ